MGFTGRGRAVQQPDHLGDDSEILKTADTYEVSGSPRVTVGPPLHPDAPVPPGPSDPLEALVRDEEREVAIRQVRGALATLSQVSRDVVVLHVICGLQWKEVATRLEISVFNARYHWYRSKAHLAQLLSNHLDNNSRNEHIR